MKVYVAGPYTGTTDYDVAVNVTRAIDAGIYLIKKGHSPYIPHLTHWVKLRAQELEVGISYDDYIKLDEEWILVSDALLYLAPSPGADRELELAEKLGLEIYRSLKEVPDGSSTA